jgi:aldehyde:ferredoxin oxidoreductase
MKIWRVNVREKTLTKETVPETWERLGGRGLIARILVDEVDAKCDPLGPENKLIYAPGLLVGHRLSSCDRISIGAKSPLTGGVKESNGGGRTGLQLTHLGIKTLIIEDQPDEDGTWLLYLSSDGARFEKADNLAGKGVYEITPTMLEKYGKHVAISLIGPGGEMFLTGAGIQNIDKDGVPSRICARGGLGAVMGKKGLKAIVIDSSGGEKPPIAHSKEYKAAQKIYNKALMEHPQIEVYAKFGTAAMVKMCHGFGALPTRNFTSGEFEGAEDITAENMREILLERGGESETTHACMAGCTIQCSNVYADKDGKTIVSPLEYENIGLLGSNLGINDLDAIARLNWELNDLALDTIEIGAALGVAATAGKMEFGDGVRALELVEEIRKGTPLGKALGNGAVATGELLGIDRIPAIKGQAMSAYDGRAIKGTGVTYATSPQGADHTYATSPQGADHTCGLTIRAKLDHLDPKVQVDNSRTSQIKMAAYDTLGVCLMGSFGFGNVPETIPALLHARYGWDVGDDILMEIGRDALSLEREFNKRAGFTAKDDRMPVWTTEEPLPPHDAVFDVSPEDLDSVFNW